MWLLATAFREKKMQKNTSMRYFKRMAATLMLCGSVLQAQATPVDVQVLSAIVKDQTIGDATVTLQKNGEQSVIGTTGADGRATLSAPFADDPATLLIIKKTGYSSLVVKCPCEGMTYAISPVMQNLDGMRIVLNWGAKPADLDSHLFYTRNHVFYSNKTGTDTLLDVDDTTSYGPETITIQRKRDGMRYAYAVHDFTDKSLPQTDGLSKSHAKVFVYIGQTLIKTYYVPKNQHGNLWTVFAVTGDGEFQDINTMSGVTGEGKTVHLDPKYLQDSTAHLASSPSDTGGVVDQHRAQELNRQGETAYHAGNYDTAIALYRQAIDLDGNYGQAYSNLGLAFQKNGRVAEAMWANRKAIALASGPTAATVRASTHYNNGRIYEAAGQWNDAVREYRRAQNEKNREAYTKAIQRMLDKGAQ